MRAGSRQARLAFPVIAVVTHVFGIVPHVLVIANEKLTHSFGVLLDFLQALVTVLQVKCLQLESTYRVLVEFFDLGTGYLRCLASSLSISLVDLAYLIELVNG